MYNAFLAPDRAAPVKNTPAFLDARFVPRHVTSAAAQKIATVHAARCRVAHAAARAFNAERLVPVAEVRRCVEEDEVLCRGLPEDFVSG